jgi:hypothetical protein
MNVTATRHIAGPFSSNRSASRKDRFRDKFQRSLRSCLRKGFTLEESFGMIWVETWEEIAITEEEQSVLYGELIRWAKTTLSAEIRAVDHTYSPQLFTVRGRCLNPNHTPCFKIPHQSNRRRLRPR